MIAASTALKESAEPPDGAAPAESAKAAEFARRRFESIKKAIADGATGFALNQIDAWLKNEPGRPELHILRGAAFEAELRFPEAREAFNQAAQAGPRNVEAFTFVARLAQRQGRIGDEIAALRRLAALQPDNKGILRRLLELEFGKRDHASALATAWRLLALAPNDTRAEVVKAVCLHEIGRTGEALADLEGLMAGASDPTDYIVAWMDIVVERQKRYGFAAAHFKSLVKQFPENWAAWACYGKLRSRLGADRDAVEALKRATDLHPRHPGIMFDLGSIERQLGNVPEALAAFERTLGIDPGHAGALRLFSREHKHAYGDAMFRRINRAVARLPFTPEPSQIEIHYAAGKAYEDVGELDVAFEHYARAGELRKKSQTWTAARMNGVLAMMRSLISGEELAAIRAKGAATDLPVLVFGAPRSGTTLIEQVIASHPKAFGAGELAHGPAMINGFTAGRLSISVDHGNPYGKDLSKATASERGSAYIDAVKALAAPNAPLRIVDKLPHNYEWVGLLEAMLPGAYLIHSRRHPVETCLSQYRIFFPEGLAFTYDLRDIGKAYRQYLDFMTYWTEMLPKGRILHVRYEDMVENLESEARRLVAHIDLPWDESCLKFYETERSVRTASVTQVRKPIYNTSVNRWRKYEPYLKPLLEELGPLVADYEAELAGEKPSPYA